MIHGGTILECIGRIHEWCDLCGLEHLACKNQGQFNDIGRSTASKDFNGFTNFKGVAGSESERYIHCSDERRCLNASSSAFVQPLPWQVTTLVDRS
jgi:hypothetical protein